MLFNAFLRKRIFISFDYDHDRRYRYLLKAIANNPQFDIDFKDHTPGEIKSDDVGRIKAVLTRRIREATHTLVVVGDHANSFHPKRRAIGERNWQWWEIKKSIEEKNKLIAVKIQPKCKYHEPLLGQRATLAKSFNIEAISKAIEDA